METELLLAFNMVCVIVFLILMLYLDELLAHHKNVLILERLHVLLAPLLNITHAIVLVPLGLYPTFKLVLIG